MAGCYGNSAEDRHFEKMLDDYLDSMDEDDEDEIKENDDPSESEKENWMEKNAAFARRNGIRV